MSDVKRCCRDGWADDLNSSRNMVCVSLSLVLISKYVEVGGVCSGCCLQKECGKGCGSQWLPKETGACGDFWVWVVGVLLLYVV
jgi:hypothetical protein